MSQQGSKGFGFGFKFTGKLKQSKTIPNKFNETQESDNVTDFVTSIDNKEIKSTAPEVKEKKELVIPLIVENKYKRRKKDDEEKSNQKNGEVIEETNDKNDLDSLARNELLKEAQGFDKKEEKTSSRRVIPLISTMMKNRIPEEYENKEKVDTSLRPDEPTIDDYQSVPVEEFGLAMLRGMGWKPDQSGQPKIIQPKIRLRGLGLGAELTSKQIESKYSKEKTREKK